MLVKCIQTSLLLVLLFLIQFIEPFRYDVNEMMYVNIPGGSACFRRLNGTHQFGCSSPLRGAYGAIEIFYNTSSVEHFIQNAVAGPYVVVMRPTLFIRSTMDRLFASNKVNGVLLALYSDSQIPDSYSPDDVCPNRNEGFCDINQPWNPVGNSFLTTDWPFPVFFVQEDSYLHKIEQCYTDFNLPVDNSQTSKPLCMLQLKSHMFGAVSSEVCMRRMAQQVMTVFKFCDPLGSENIIYPMINLPQTKENKLIAVIARLDGVSMFDGIAPGAMSAVSGLASLVILGNIINDLKAVIQDHTIHKGIIFMLLNGESFDYIGSQRVVYDMEQGTFMPNNKISLDNIGMVIELSQMGPDKTFYVHRTNDRTALDFADSLVQISKNMSVEFKLSSLNRGLPPVSLNTFLSANPNISGIVITNYDTNFSNRYYNGMLDNGTNINVNKTSLNLPPVKNSTQYNLASAAVVLARGLVSAINKDQSIVYDITVNRYVQNMVDVLSCYLVSKKCSLFQKVYPPIVSNPNLPDVVPLYVGIANSLSYITRATHRVFSYLATTSENLSQENCTALCSKTDELHCFWVKEDSGVGKCIRSPIQLLPAVSPAFEIEGYDWTSKKYSTWTESVWSDTSVHMFIKGETQKEILVFVCGLVLCFVSLVSVYFINKKSDLLLTPKSRPENC